MRIEMPFDRFLFVGGLQQAEKLLRRNRGHDVYTVSRYSSLEPLFGHHAVCSTSRWIFATS